MTRAPGAGKGGGGDGFAGAGQPNDHDDEHLLGELRTAVARWDPVPASVAALPYGLLSWRDPDAELAGLVADSRELAGAVRGGDHEVLLRFELDPLSITVEASPDGSGRYRMIGQVEPGGAGGVDIRQVGPVGVVGAELSVRCDEWGRFEAYPVAPGTVSLRWTPDSGSERPVHTTWVVL